MFVFEDMGAKYRYDYAKIAGELNAFKDKGDDQSAVAMIRKFCKEDLFFLMYFVLNMRACNHPWIVDRIYEVQDHHHRTLDIWGRAHWKSNINTYALTIQKILCNPESRIAIFSETRQIAKSFLRRIKITAEENNLLRGAFQDIFYSNPERQSPKWSEDEGLIVKRKGAYTEASVEAWGLDGLPTGKHFDIMVWDDVVNETTIASSGMMEKLENSFRLSFGLASNPCEMRVIGTIYHYMDLNQKLSESGEWFVRKYPAEVNGHGVLLSDEDIAQKKKDMGSYVWACLDGETSVLMSDWRLKKIKDIRAGEVVVGLTSGRHDRKARFVPAEVRACSAHTAPVVKITLDNGDEIICTENHKWWTGRWRGKEKRRDYSPAGFGYGRVKALSRALDISFDKRELSAEEKYAAAYLGGMFDGEGTCSGGYISITQSHVVHPEVCEKIEWALSVLGFKYEIYTRVASQEENERNGRNSKDSRIYYITGGRQERFRFLSITDPAKRMQIVSQMYERSAKPTKDCERAKIVSIEPFGERTVYNIETETGNYIADGYVSSNSQMMLDPVPKDRQAFKPEWVKYYRTMPDRMNIAIFCDPANAEDKRADCSVFSVIGIDQFKNYYLLDMIRDRMNLVTRWVKLRDLAVKWACRTVHYEVTGQGQIDIQYFNDKMMDEGVHLDIIPIKNTRTDKETRIINSLSPLFEMGRFFLPDNLIYYDLDEKRHDLIHDFLADEYSRFPFAQHDDMIDCLAQCRHEDVKLLAPFTARPEMAAAKRRFFDDDTPQVSWMAM